MKKVSQRLLVAVCAVSLVCVFGLFGCSSSDEDTSSGSDSSEATETTESSSSSASSSSSSSSSDEADESSEEVELQIFADESLKDALDEVQDLYTEQTGVTFAATRYEDSDSLLGVVVDEKSDILITVPESSMELAKDDSLVDDSSVVDLFNDDLVIVAAEDSDIDDLTLDDLASGDYTLAVGDDDVLVGNYAKQALSSLEPPCWIDPEDKAGDDSDGMGGTFDGTPLEGKVVEETNVSNLCKDVSSGDADLAIVSNSDVYTYGDVKVVGVIPNDTHTLITYPAAVCADSESAKEAEEFIDWAFTDKDAIEIWEKWGFEMA